MIEACAASSPPTAARRLRRVAGRLLARLQLVESLCSDAARRLTFRARTALAQLGVCGKPILVMSCAKGSENEGFYGQFTAILGLLDYFETNRNAIAGVSVDFGDRGLYYDPAHGPNAWQYHFEPIAAASAPGTVERALDTVLEEWFFARGEQLARGRAFELIDRHVRARPHIRERVEAYARAHFAGFQLIGIHYRGTDKWVEARRVPYEEVCTAVRAALGGMDPERWRLFAASDEQAFVDCMEKAFPGRVLSWPTRRAPEGNHLDSVAIDFRMEDNYRKGADAVIDCLLLSRCDRLIRTISSLGLCAGYFNPAMPVTVLNRYHAAVEAGTR